MHTHKKQTSICIHTNGLTLPWPLLLLPFCDLIFVLAKDRVRECPEDTLASSPSFLRVNSCVYVCLCVYICVRVCMCICIRHTCIVAELPTSELLCISMSVYVCIYMYMLRVCACLCMCTYACVQFSSFYRFLEFVQQECHTYACIYTSYSTNFTHSHAYVHHIARISHICMHIYII
jgi:hypothetical protein